MKKKIGYEITDEAEAFGSPYIEGTRRKLFPRFSHAVIYDVTAEQITVIAVSHHRRDPEYWVERVKTRR